MGSLPGGIYLRHVHLVHSHASCELQSKHRRPYGLVTGSITKCVVKVAELTHKILVLLCLQLVSLPLQLLQG
jgi:hypothetical protein